MPRRVVIVVPDHAHGKADQYLAELLQAGCLLVSDTRFTQEQAAGSVNLIYLCSDDWEAQQVLDSGLNTLADALQLTAYQAWQRLGGKQVWSADHQRLKRHAGTVFKKICALAARLQLTFADLDPADFKQYMLTDWSQYGLSEPLAGILGRAEVYDVRIFVQLTDAEIGSLNRCGIANRAALVAARDRLKVELAGQ